MAIAGLGKTIGWQTILLSPFGPSTGHPWGISHDRRPLRESMRDLGLDRWTAVAVATHDLEIDQEALAPALHRSEEHTSELQSLMRISYAVFCLTKNKKNTQVYIQKQDIPTNKIYDN